MADQPIHFPEYGEGGDKPGARRMRHAFRLSVIACVFLVVMLWVTERHLRYELSESQYQAALTLEPESARVLLRYAVKRDTETREAPSPRYVAALAEREESDLVLPTYEKAYRLDPDDGFLALRYGCRLFIAEHYAEARERFREAGLQPPPNALPGYLEAAALAMAQPPDKDLSEPLALVAKTNSSGKDVAIPEPLWARGMPTGGLWHMQLQRQIADECCAPLYKFIEIVTAQAKRRIAVKEVRDWDTWLVTIQDMGQRLMAKPSLSILQTIAGIRIQIAALDLRIAISEGERGAPDSALVERRTRLSSAMALLTGFEDRRDTLIAAEVAKYRHPVDLCWKTLVVVGGVYLLVYLLAHATRAKRHAWTISHSSAGLAILCGAPAVLFCLLLAATVLQHVNPTGVQESPPWLRTLHVVWWTVVSFALALGVAYPFAAIPGVNRVLHARGLTDIAPEVRHAARRAHRMAHISLMRRYYGVLFGQMMCVACAWTIVYRIAVSLYPWQTKLLASGLGYEETQVVKQALSLLGIPLGQG